MADKKEKRTYILEIDKDKCKGSEECVDACPAGARIFGDLNDKESEISKKIATNNVSVLKPIMGTEPQTYYIDLDLSAVEAKEIKEEH